MFERDKMCSLCRGSGWVYTTKFGYIDTCPNCHGIGVIENKEKERKS